MLWRHVAVWRGLQEEDLDEEERRFRYAQFRRRMQTSGMIGVVGLLMLFSPLVESPWANLIFWSVVVLLLVWMVLLAVADWMSTKAHYGPKARYLQAEREKLEAEVERLRAQEGNGKSTEKQQGRG